MSDFVGFNKLPVNYCLSLLIVRKRFQMIEEVTINEEKI